jgi:hypothetical protein
MMPALAGVVLAVAAACGGNGSGDDTASGRAIEPEAQQRAESIVLTLADFPNDWRASARESDDTGQKKFNKCIGVDYSGLTRIGEAGRRTSRRVIRRRRSRTSSSSRANSRPKTR